MRLTQYAAPLLAILAHAARVVSDDRDSIVPGAYIVEMEGDEQASSLYDELRSDGIAVVPGMDLRYRLFNGGSFRVEGSDEDNDGALAGRIAAKGQVKAIWPVRRIQMPKMEPSSVARNGTDGPLPPSTKHKRQTSPAADTYSTHVMTQVDKLRAAGITGKGIRVGVVDTGVDYRHPALGGCFGPGCKIAYGYDLSGDDYMENQGPPVPDDDPLDTCQGHGTHVAGIIMAQENELGFTGAAPDVTLGMYKVSGCPGYTTSEILVSAFYRAYEDGSDVISCSAGDDSGWATDAAGVAVSRIAEAGVPVVVALGNSGNLGVWQVASPASGIEVAAIGSADNTVLPTLLTRGEYKNETGEYGFGWRTGQPVLQTNITLPLWYSAAQTDLCDSTSEDLPDFNNTIVFLPSFSACGTEVQAKKIAANRGRYILYYPESESRMYPPSISVAEIEGVGLVAPRRAAEWIKALSTGETIEVTMGPPQQAEAFVENFSNGIGAGLTSAFSSWGPTWEGHLKPQFTAPGGGILSTWTWGSGDYMVNPGTSMSTPFVAAVYALVGQARKTLNAQALRNVVSATAQPQPYFDGTQVHEDILAPVAQQGAGLVQAFDAAQCKTLLSVSGFSLNDTDNFSGKQSFSIQNTATEPVTYALGQAKAVTVYTFAPGAATLQVARAPPPTVARWAEVMFSADSITVPAGASAEVSFSVAPPSGLNATLLPVYSGYITLDASSGESLSIPYLGVAGSMHDIPVLLPLVGGLNGVYLSSTADHFLIPVAANKTFTIPRPEAAGGNAVFPKFVAIPTVGTTELHIDLVAVGNTTLPTTDRLGYRSLGSIPGYPLKFVPANGVTYNFRGVLADRTIVPEGSYKFVASGLRIFGDATKKEDWDVVESVPFILKYLS